MSQSWLRQKERGGIRSLRFMVWLMRHGGMGAAELLLYPIAAYFTLFSGATRRASLDFLARATGKPGSWLSVFHHYHVFAATILHRLAFVTGQSSRFDVRIHGANPLERLIAEGRGCLLVGAHLGSFEVLRTLGVSKKGLSVKMLMHVGNAPAITRILDSIAPDVAADVIPVGRPDALLGIDAHLGGGGLVALLGDRCVQGEKRIACDFLGKSADFPLTPMVLASILKAPVVLAVGLYRGRRRYDVHFELLADGADVDRRSRDEAAQNFAQQYAKRLEHYCRIAPYNWFNFYDFWE